ncbi:MAG: DapH/DapD/GlmU-related protein [Saprospiraceae bacterium]|nr:DapH/DapD/GlmU-related protein [Saprospiraceae bacterium]
MSHFIKDLDAEDILGMLSAQLSVDYQVYGRTRGGLISAVGDSRQAGTGRLSFLPEDFPGDTTLTRSMLITAKKPETTNKTNVYCVVEDPRAAFIDLLSYLANEVGLSPHHRSFLEQSRVDASAVIAESAVIHPGVSVGPQTLIGDGCVIHRGVIIGEGSVIRDNTCIGMDGITVYKAKDGRLLRFPHVSGLEIGRGAEIGVNCSIAGGILSATTIGDDVCIGNLCNIGHGVTIGSSAWLAAGILVGGHTQIGEYATIGLGSCIRDNLSIGQRVSVAMGSVITKNVRSGASVFGNPAKSFGKLKTGPVR